MMKTPREILFEKHKAAQQKLDAIRESIVSECARPRPQQAANVPTHAVGTLAAFWQELFWPYRRIWTGLSVVWVGIIALRLTEPGTAVRETVRVTPQMAAAVIVEQRRELALVLGDTGGPQVALPPPPQPALPRPRSERRSDIFAV
jgi:hypothetical protein